MSYWNDKTVVITGGGGFIGSSINDRLKELNCKQIFAVRSRDYDLTKEDHVTKLMEDIKPDVIIHLAGLVGGILANKENPADFFYKNMMMGTLIIHNAWKYGVKKIVSAGSCCSYPENAPVPLKEETIWDGFPQEQSSSYGLAKRMLQIQSIAYYKQHGFKSVVCLPGNVYGPNDNFDIYKSHVIPALVRKFVEAAERNDEKVVVWGTGKATRDFVYVEDIIKGILLAAEIYETPEIVNISSGVEISIREVVEILTNLTKFTGEVVWDTSKPSGQLRRWISIDKARRELGFIPDYDIQKGLEITVEWFKKNKRDPRL